MNLYPWKSVKKGEKSHRVAVIQYLLRAHGHTVTVDRDFGSKTDKAVREFQTTGGLASDGVVGPATWSKLVITVKSGSTGDAVKAVQSLGLLGQPGDDPLVVDGKYGPITKQYVGTFQGGWGLAVDGVVGKQTWSFLVRRDDAWPLVQVGATEDTNWRVLAVQYLLRASGATIVADGNFGSLSGEAMKKFQLSIRADDISTTCGQLDWPKLIKTVRRGDTGDAVRALQALLDPGMSQDGVFGPATEAAVRGYQNTFVPPADGVVGPKTWHALTVPMFD